MGTTTNNPVISGTAEKYSSFVSSGQSGSGTVPGSTTAPPHFGAVAQSDASGVTDNLVSIVTSSGTDTQSFLHLENPEMAAAALAMNQSPAPTDPVLQQIAAIESRVTSVETIVNATTPPEYHARLLALEETVAALIKLAEEAAPWWTKITHLFNVHFSGKINP